MTRDLDVDIIVVGILIHPVAKDPGSVEKANLDEPRP